MKKQKRCTCFLISIFVAGIIGMMNMPIDTQAAMVTFDLDIAYTGSNPSGTAPWLTATFDDGGTPGSVTLTMMTSGLSTGEFVTNWYFNSSILPLSIAFDSGQEALDGVSIGSNAFMAAGDGLYDILFEFEQSNSMGGVNRFTPGETSVYNITGNGITANSFNIDSAPGGGNGPFRSVAHVQGINANPDSGHVAPSNPPASVPIPNAALLFGTGLIGLVLISRRKRMNQET